MKNNLMKLIVAALLAAAVYYAYQQGLFGKAESKIEHRVEETLNNICDPSKEDCSAFEEDLEV